MKNFEQVTAALQLRCPCCRQGKLYRNAFSMNDDCPHCQLPLTAEPGLYIGSIYPNYAATVVLGTALYWILAFACSMNQSAVLWVCAGFIIIFPLWFHRYARSIWMSLIYCAKHTPQTERQEKTSPPLTDHEADDQFVHTEK